MAASWGSSESRGDMVLGLSYRDVHVHSKEERKFYLHVSSDYLCPTATWTVAAFVVLLFNSFLILYVNVQVPEVSKS